MTDIVLRGNFFQQARGLKFADTGTLVWTFDAATNTLTGAASGSAPGVVDTANSPAAGEFAKFTDADTIEGRTVAETKSDLSLGNVDNTSDANKPVSTAQQTALNLKANLASPALSGTPTAPTAAANTNTTQIATTAYVQTEIADLIGTAPGVLDTLGEISDAINDDANLYTTLVASIATKQPIDADLTAIAALASAADKVPYSTGAQTWALADFTLQARQLLDDASFPAMLTTLGAQPLDAGLTSLAGLGATAGLIEKTATDTYTERLIGVGAGTSIPTRADADTRYMPSAQYAGGLMLMGA